LGNVEFVGINDLTDAATLAHLLKYDSVHGRFGGEVYAEGDAIVVNGQKIQITAERDPANLKWGNLELTLLWNRLEFFVLKRRA
jgi:glyceraldehyde 3-phosphate dehydrogenase